MKNKSKLDNMSASEIRQWTRQKGCRFEIMAIVPHSSILLGVLQFVQPIAVTLLKSYYKYQIR